MAVKLNKQAKANAARKNAEALKSKKKADRNAKANAEPVRKLGSKVIKAKSAKGKSLVGQSKRKK